MFVIYNGVVLDVISTEGVEREFIYSEDETTLLYTKWTISVVALVNPQVGGTANGLSVAGADKLIRARLAAPRRKLFLLEACAGTGTDNTDPSPQPPKTTTTELKSAPAGPSNPSPNSAAPPSKPNSSGASRFGDNFEILLECPYGDLKSDAKDGPTPLHYDITACQGVMSYMVRFVIQCYVSPEWPSQNPPPPGPDSSPSPVAAHRWKIVLGGTDKNYFTIRKIVGTITFRKDMLEVTNLSPEDFRAFLAHPVPVGYKRMPPQFDISEDGTVLIYTLTDIQQTTNFDPGKSGATDIEISESVQFSRANLGPGGSFSGTSAFTPGDAASVGRGIGEVKDRIRGLF